MGNENANNGFSDEKLVAMLKDGSKAHARLLYRRYNNQILHHYMGKRGFKREVAEELTQETFFRVFRTLRNQELQGRFIGLLYKAAYHAFVDYLAEKEKQKAWVSIDDVEKVIELPDSDPGGEKALYQKQTHHAVWAAVRRLNEKQRLVMELHLEELSYKEIAEILEMTTGYVGRIIFDAKKQLKVLLKEYC